MYIPPEMDRSDHVRCFDTFFLPRCNLWFFDGQWHVEENYGLMDQWTYQSIVGYSGSWDMAYVMVHDIIKTRRLFPVLYSDNNPVKGQW